MQMLRKTLSTISRLLAAAQVKVLRSQTDVISGLTEIDRQQRDVLGSSAQLWQARRRSRIGRPHLSSRRDVQLALVTVSVAMQAAQENAASLRHAQEEQSSLQRAVLGDLRCGVPSGCYARGSVALRMTMSNLTLADSASPKNGKMSAREYVSPYLGNREKLLRDCFRALASASQGVQDTLATVATYQQRSDAVLTHLLGRSYRASDVLFYLAGGAAALGAGATPLTRSARLPLLAVFGGALAAERLGLDWLQPLGVLAPGPNGQVVLCC